MKATGSFSDLDLGVYRSLIPPPGMPVEALARLLGKTHAEVMASLNRLIDAHLVRRDDQLYQSLSPALAEAQALGSEELELSSRRVALEDRRNIIRQLGPEWTAAVRDNPPSAAVDVVYDSEAIANVLMHYAASCTRELLSVAPGSGPGRIDPRTRMANMFSLDRGVRTLALYQHIALRERSTRAYLRELVDHGAHVRIASSLPGRSLVIDREVALLPIPHVDLPSGGLAIVREPNVVAWVVATFEQLWSEASTLDELLGAPQGGPELDQTRAAILRLMGEGEKDEAISRRLSISVRTCRRHIADYMAQVGATSRFQAGVIASRDGHLDAAAPN
ncbi:MAG TPA: LuxR C-terminal-related transcriptional regulator [Jatrophihabitantaceae bacterium]|jgi:DNA-binding CsgD family transcriptional regulator|nr:LuxR C-terminal-related transcriptional regulator [Jatrophihabitantaceae bacterium]